MPKARAKGMGHTIEPGNEYLFVKSGATVVAVEPLGGNGNVELWEVENRESGRRLTAPSRSLRPVQPRR